MPQRSQYKFFTKIMKASINHTGFQFFVRSILFCGYTGYFYSWSTALLPLHRLVQLFEFLCVQKIDWDLFVEANVRILFFMIKEYMFFFVKQQKGCRDALIKLNPWLTHERYVFETMNAIRTIFYKPFINPHRHMLVASHKQQSHATITETLPVTCTTRQDPIQLFLTDGFRRIRTANWAWSLSNVRRFYEEAFSLQSKWLYEAQGRTERFHEWCYAAFLIKNISSTRLPFHHLRAQVHAIHNRFDIPIRDLARIQQVSKTLFCPCCGESRANRQQPNPSCCSRTALGHSNVAYDPHLRISFCMGPSQRRRRKTPVPVPCGQFPCIELDLLGKVVRFFGRSFSLCSYCAVPCLFEVRNGGELPACSICSQQPPIQKQFCSLCLRQSPQNRLVRIFDDVTHCSASPWSVEPICNRHRVGDKEIFLKSQLLLSITTH